MQPLINEAKAEVQRHWPMRLLKLETREREETRVAKSGGVMDIFHFHSLTRGSLKVGRALSLLFPPLLHTLPHLRHPISSPNLFNDE